MTDVIIKNHEIAALPDPQQQQPTYDGKSLLIDKNGVPIPPDVAKRMVDGGAQIKGVTASDIYADGLEIEDALETPDFLGMRGEVETERHHIDGRQMLRIGHNNAHNKMRYKGVIVETVIVHHVAEQQIGMECIFEDAAEAYMGPIEASSGMTRILATPEPPVGMNDPSGPYKLELWAKRRIDDLINRLDNAVVEKPLVLN